MTVIRPNSVSGINSITAQADEIKVFKSNGTQGGLIIGGANLNATSGISTLLALNVTGNVSIAGTLTYQDVTNVDSVGIITARSGVNISGGNLQMGGTNVLNSGRALYNLEQIKLGDSKELVLGSGNDLKIYHSGTHSFISEEGNGALKFKGDDIRFEDAGGFERLRIDSGGRVLIGGTSSAGDGNLIVYSSDRLHAAIRGAGTSSNHANGYNLLSDNYTATESQLNLGVSYSGSGIVFSRNVKVSGSADNTYLSSNAQYSTRPSAFKLDDDGSFVFLNTSTNATTAIDSAVTLSERLRITSAGRVGINETSPDALLHLSTGASTTCELRLQANNTGSGSGDRGRINVYSSRNDGTAYQAGYVDIDRSSGTEDKAHLLVALNNGSGAGERLRIRSDGNIGIGNVDPPYLITAQKSGTAFSRFYQLANNTGEDYYILQLRHAGARSGQNGIGMLFKNDGGTTVGKIDFGQSTTQYRTSSDYRLKENAVPISDGISRLKTLKPYRFNWIAEKDQPKVDGFFAHEVTAVPESISGAKDEIDSDNNPVYQSIDHSKLVPLLTAALQEEIAKREALEARIAALEGS